jgi:hypothetical protein
MFYFPSKQVEKNLMINHGIRQIKYFIVAIIFYDDGE